MPDPGSGSFVGLVPCCMSIGGEAAHLQVALLAEEVHGRQGFPIILSSCIPIAAAPGRNIARPLKHIWGERNGARFTSSWICRGLAAWQAITHRPDKETLGPHFNDPPFFDLSHFETKAPPPLLQR
ncbi:hypothetical protein AVEN_1187-1 [Araneus ventricosus]|uniref:Uncharacterized protein n=1 Tax=Araneus ventricosus TaxID=182803 RepID=A0A4Y2EFF0_ARAVE|nr:hypothetical protein AVEN_1187-1 [Araneus ventricosus]